MSRFNINSTQGKKLVTKSASNIKCKKIYCTFYHIRLNVYLQIPDRRFPNSIHLYYKKQRCVPNLQAIKTYIPT